MAWQVKEKTKNRYGTFRTKKMEVREVWKNMVTRQHDASLRKQCVHGTPLLTQRPKRHASQGAAAAARMSSGDETSAHWAHGGQHS